MVGWCLIAWLVMGEQDFGSSGVPQLLGSGAAIGDAGIGAAANGGATAGVLELGEVRLFCHCCA